MNARERAIFWNILNLFHLSKIVLFSFLTPPTQYFLSLSLSLSCSSSFCGAQWCTIGCMRYVHTRKSHLKAIKARRTPHFSKESDPKILTVASNRSLRWATKLDHTGFKIWNLSDEFCFWHLRIFWISASVVLYCWKSNTLRLPQLKAPSSWSLTF